MGFKNYIRTSTIIKKKMEKSFEDKLKKKWSLIESLNNLNSIPDHSKTNMAIKLEEAIRLKIQKEK